MPNDAVSFVKSSLRSHALLALLVGALLYLICATGTLVVFYEEIERWLQPLAEEQQLPGYPAIENTFNSVLQNPELVTEHLFLVYPNAALPRYKIATEEQSWYLTANGELGPEANDYFSDFLINLHTQLTLPGNLGLYLIGIISIALMALLISGFCAHPNILKDAFHWRRNKSEQLREVDTHNRLSVWSAPFTVIMAITGAYFGVVSLLMSLYVWAFYPGSQAEFMAEVFGAEPELVDQPTTLNLTQAMARLAALNPEGQPLFAIVHDAGTDKHFLEIFSQQPGRLIYSENFRFDMAGNYLGKAGYSDGSIGKQIAYSVYRIHFGHFGGLWVKFLYFILGAMLTMVCVTGINIWLMKRRRKDWLFFAWPAWVWSLPAALLMTAALQLVWLMPGALPFWLLLGVLTPLLTVTYRRSQNRQLLYAVNAAATLVLLACYWFKFGFFWHPSTAITLALLLWLVAMIVNYVRVPTQAEPEPRRVSPAALDKPI